MTQEHVAVLLEDARLTLEELAVSCAVSREWIIEHVRSGVLLIEPDPDPARWTFSGRDLLRTRRLYDVERRFAGNGALQYRPDRYRRADVALRQFSCHGAR